MRGGDTSTGSRRISNAIGTASDSARYEPHTGTHTHIHIHTYVAGLPSTITTTTAAASQLVAVHSSTTITTAAAAAPHSLTHSLRPPLSRALSSAAAVN